MQIQVLYFARFREVLGKDSETLLLEGEGWTVARVREHLRARGGAWSGALATGKVAKAAVNRAMVGDEAVIPANAEVAFFPPVTGG